MYSTPIQAAVQLFSPENLAGYAATAVVAVLGFLVTWFLLKTILYKPLRKIMDTRMEHVQDVTADCESKSAELDRMRTALEEQEQKLAGVYEEKFRQRLVETQSERDRILAVARAEADALVAKAEKTARKIQEDQQRLIEGKAQTVSLELLGLLLQNQSAAHAQEDSVKQLLGQILAAKE